MAEIHCRHFNGYKPCGRGNVCERASCGSYQAVGQRILLVHLEAFGAVLRSTGLIAAIKRKYPSSQITWVTKAPAHHLLQNLKDLDRVLTLSPEDLLKLSVLSFDLALVVDKSLSASAVVKACAGVTEVRGFRVDEFNGAVVPANAEAHELWNLGLNDQLKFFDNQKSELQLVHESLALGPYARDEYQAVLSPDEQRISDLRRQSWRRGDAPIIGINTGCSATLPHKKLSVAGHCDLIGRILKHRRLKGCPIVLLGGPEDRERNEAIAKAMPVLLSPTDKGLRDGMASVAATDLVFSGDSLGMHMAIALKKWTVAWFGPSCHQEIDLFERGRKILTEAPCSPCWKRVCSKTDMCYDQVDFNAAVSALDEGLNWLTLSSRPHFPETSFSPSPF